MRRRRIVGGSATLTALALVLATTAVPAQAAASPSAGAPYVSVAHHRVLVASVKAKAAVSVTVLGAAGFPATGVSAVVLSVSVADPAASGGLVGYPAGSKRPGVVSVSLTRGHASANDVVVTPGSRGRVSLYNGSSATERLVMTAIAYYAAPGTAKATRATTAFVPVTPRRLGSILIPADRSDSLLASGRAGIPTSDVGGVVVSLTVAAPAVAGALVAYPYGSKPPKQSTLSMHAGRAASAAVVITPGSKGRVSFANRSAKPVRVYADVVGYLRTLHVPTAPRSVAARASSSAATVTWTAPASDGGAPIVSYRVAATPGNSIVTVSGSARSAAVHGLLPKVAYRFTVVASNSRGRGPVSTPTGAVTPYTLPGAPTALTATSTGAGQVAITWTAPADDGGAAVAGYRVTADPGGATVTSATSPAVLAGLTAGSYYTFTVVALNAAGSSTASMPSLAALVDGSSRASSAPDGSPGNDDSGQPAVSVHARYVAFESKATNLVGQTVSRENVYLRDRQEHTTTLVSVAVGGTTGGDYDSNSPSVSADGRYVVFSSAADNLVAGDTNNYGDVFVRDMVNGTTRLVSAAHGVEGDSLSYEGVISADGSTVAFTSYATNLVSLGTVDKPNVFLVSLSSGAVTLASEGAGGVAADGSSGDPAISADGNDVAFDSGARNLETAHPVGTNPYQQVYKYDAGAATTTLVSYAGAVGNFSSVRPAISGDGTYIAFGSMASNLSTADPDTTSDVFVADTATGTVTLVSATQAGPSANAPSQNASISSDGTLVTYDSSASDLVAGDDGHHLQVLRSDWEHGQTALISSDGSGVEGNGTSNVAAISGDGLHVVYDSLSTNLTPGTTNPSVQIVAADLG